MTFPLRPLLGAAVLVAGHGMVHGTLTYPHCGTTNRKDCCVFGSGSMMHRGYTLIKVEGNDMAITCSHGVLRCSNENPNTMASYDAAASVVCPDFASMMESRSEMLYLDGVQDKPMGTVKAADLSN